MTTNDVTKTQLEREFEDAVQAAALKLKAALASAATLDVACGDDGWGWNRETMQALDQIKDAVHRLETGSW